MTTFLSHAQANTVIYYLALFFAYFVVVTLAQFFKAWVALRLGDSTPAELGFLSWNPLDHVDIVGMVCLLAVGLGWASNVPINSLNIHGRHRTAKIIFAHLSETLAYIAIGLVTMIVLIVLFDRSMIVAATAMALSGGLNYHSLHMMYPTYSSVHIAVGFIAICAMYLSIMLGALQFIIDCYYLFIEQYLARYAAGESGALLFFIMPLLALVVLSGPLRLLIMYIIVSMSTFITQLIGLF